jgi:hypothetical protein
MAYAPSRRAVMNEYVTAMLDLVIGLISEIQPSYFSSKGAPDVLRKSANAEGDSNVQGERIACTEGRLSEQSRIQETSNCTSTVARNVS